SSRSASRRGSECGSSASLHHVAGCHARPKGFDRAVPDHPAVAFLASKLFAVVARGFLRVEAQQDNRALALGQAGEAHLQAIYVEHRVSSWSFDHVRVQESVAKFLTPPL